MTSNTQLANNLTCASGPGLILGPGVTLDLHGHTIAGPGGVTSVGVEIPDFGSDTVKNGVLTGWGVGFGRTSEGGSGVASIDSVVFARNNTGAKAFGSSFVVANSAFNHNVNGVDGFYSVVTISDSSFFANTGTAASSVSEGRLTITRSSFAANGIATRCSETGNDISRSTFTQNTLGISGYWCGGSESGNNFVGNSTAVQLDSPYPALSSFEFTFSNNRFASNAVALDLEHTATYLGGNQFVLNKKAVDVTVFDDVDGGSHIGMDQNLFTLNDDAVYIEGPATISRTTAVYNKHYGIYAPLATDGGGNVARGNGYSPQCIGVVCSAR